MLRLIYRVLLRLRPREWREEMLGVFDQARQDARERGWLAYGRFGCREIAGLLRLEAGGRWRWALGGALVGLSAAGLFAPPEMYTSQAMIRTTPSSIPERFVPAYEPLTANTLQTAIMPVILSRNTVTNIVQTYDLFRSERALVPMEDIVELFQRRAEIRQADFQTIRVSFSYGDPRTAQKVARDLLTRLIDETIRERHSMSMMTVNFLTNQADRAASAWEALSVKARTAGPNSERLLLDRDLARSHYETLRRQVIEAEMIAGMEERRQGPSVEVLDLPSLPERPQISHAAILAAGAFGGFALGLLLGWLRRLRLNANLQPAALH